MSAPPATPQRTATHSHSHSVSVSLPHGFSPLSPFTPLSLRSFASASPSSGSFNPSPSSTLATPASIKNFNVNAAFSSPPVAKTKRISWATPSPSVTHHGHAHHESMPSIADLKHNWRSRANENGIKVSQSSAKLSLGDDPSFIDDADSSIISERGFVEDEALLPPPFLSTQRRRALSHAAALPSDSSPSTHHSFQNAVTRSAPHPRIRAPLTPLSPLVRRNAPVSPVQTRKVNVASQYNVMATPPPNRNLAERLRLNGSFTDPAQPRQRDAFATASHANDVSFDRDLFDIHEDENDYENELEYDSYQYEIRDYYQLDPHGVGARETQSDIEEEQFEVEYPSLPPQQQYQEYQYQQPHILSQKQTYSALPPAYSHPPGLIHHHALAQHHGPSFPPGLGLPLFAQGQAHQLSYGYETQMQQQRQHGQLAPSSLAVSMVHQSQVPLSTVLSETASLPAPSPVPLLHSSPAPATMSPVGSLAPQYKDAVATSAPKACSICARRPPSLARLAVLTPCGHALCPACLTSALNIVGEKDMECAMCRAKVADFKLMSIAAESSENKDAKDLSRKDENIVQETKVNGDGGAMKSTIMASVDTKANQASDFKDRGRSFFDPPSSPCSHSSIGAEKTFDFGHDLFDDGDMMGFRASTPPPKAVRKVLGAKKVDHREGTKEGVVALRIDNVPWDITPPRIINWLRQPIVRVHVLLDKKGKTMSHAFVEVEDEEIAGKVLRGETETGKFRGSVLGKGRRARGVTITRSSQGELMTALFPSWLGTFDRCRPSLAGLDSARVIASLESGLMTESEVASLLYLIRSPDAHFLKVPSLPFHALISVLSKFPADVDSRVFWSSALRDVLFDVAFAAIQVLVARIETQTPGSHRTGEAEYPPTLLDELVKVTSTCQAFTTQQTAKVLDFINTINTKDGKDLEADVSVPHSRTVSATGSVSSSASSRFAYSGKYIADPTDADIEDEDGEGETDDKNTGRKPPRTSRDALSEDDDDLRTSSSPTAAASSVASSSDDREANVNSHPEGVSSQDENAVLSAQSDNSQQALGDLAREFGVEARLVEALVQRLGMAQR